MEANPRAWHRIRRNETSRQPRRHIFIDTEAAIERREGGHEQTWRLGCATFVTTEKGRPKVEFSRDYTCPEALWSDIANFTSVRGRTVVWAHNIGYDLRTSRALCILSDQGWRLVAHNIAPRGSWLEWRRDAKTLVMVDSGSIFPTTLARIGTWFGMGKVSMAMDSTDNEAWLERCRADVAILKTAILAYLDWLQEADMGNWQLTGAGQSWALFRHKFLTHPMVVHDDIDALKAERRALWAGRCEAYWRGEINGQTVHEWDFTQAYARIARDEPVPVRYLGPMPPSCDWRGTLGNRSTSLLARVRVSTRVPVLPAEKDGRILWPIGNFETVVWDVEIAAALREGAQVEVIEGWLYRKRPALKAWGEWIISQLDSPDDECPTWQKAVLKHHSRALIGRMAMTYSDWQEFGTAPDSRICRSTLWEDGEEQPRTLMQVGRDVWIDSGRVESGESMPMVTGYVQAIARVRLWEAIREFPERVLLYVDTDSLLVTHNHAARAESVARKLSGYGLRLKRSWDGFAIYGPRQIVTGERARVSGVPTSASRIGPREFAGDVWESLSRAIEAGHLDKVVTRGRRWRIEGTDHRREGTPLGWTSPITMDLRERRDSETV